MIDAREKGFNYNYIKLVNGPFSGELERDLIDLANYNLVNDLEFNLTENGQAIVEDFCGVVKQNESIITKIDEIIRRFREYSLKELLAYVYSLPHPYRRGLTIATTPFRTPILYRLSDEKASVKFKINQEQLKDLSACLSEEKLKQWKEVREDLENQRFLTYNEVFQPVKA
jgi:hypothetical protein